VLAELGRADEGRRELDRARALAEAVGDPAAREALAWIGLLVTDDPGEPGPTGRGWQVRYAEARVRAWRAERAGRR
jgi:hypothetical protein